MFHITWAPLATNLLSGLISETVDVARRLEDERKDQNIHPPLLSCHAVVLAAVVWYDFARKSVRLGTREALQNGARAPEKSRHTTSLRNNGMGLALSSK